MSHSHGGPTADVSVRVAWADDAEAIAGVQVRAWAELYAGVLPPEVLPTDVPAVTAQWRQALTRPADARNRVLVALERNRVVGYALTSPAADPDCDPVADGELAEVTLDPGERDKGHGSRLLQAAVDTLAADRFTRAVTWANVEDDALRLAKIAVAAEAFSDTTAEMMRLRAPGDPHKPNLIHHVEDILFAVLHAWQTRSTLVLAECDRQVLVELLNCVLANGIALPYGIPDLRKARTSDSKMSGAIANLEPSDYNDLNAILEDSAIQTYRQRLSQLSESHTVNVGILLKAALEEAHRNSPLIREAPADITLLSTRVRTIDTVDLDAVEIDPFGWANRKPSKPKMHIIVLASSRCLG